MFHRGSHFSTLHVENEIFFFFFLDDRSASLLVGPPRCLIYRNKRCSITFLLNFPPSSKFTLPTNIDKIPKNLHSFVPPFKL